MTTETATSDAVSTASCEDRTVQGTSLAYPPDEPALQNDIRLLDGLLDAAIKRLEGEESFRLVEEVRAATQQLRNEPSLEAARRLRDRLMAAPLPAATHDKGRSARISI